MLPQTHDFVPQAIRNQSHANCSFRHLGYEMNQNKEYCQNEEINVQSSCCQTETDLSMDTMKRQENYMQVVTEQLMLAKSQLLASKFSKESFENNNELTKFYTGVPTFQMLNHVFDLVAPHVKTTLQNALDQFQEFILVLIRMNSPLQDLAFRFNISVPTASRLFDKWIHVMSIRLKFLIKWPDRDELQARMPAVFQRNFENHACFCHHRLF